MKKDRSVFQAFSMIGQFGINMLVPIFICSFIGYLTDKKLGTGYIVIIMFFIGAIAGGYNVFRMARSIYSKDIKPLPGEGTDDDEDV